MNIATEAFPDIFREAPGEQLEASLPQACLSDIADSLDWVELLDALVSDFALALVNGEAQYMQGVGDLMGRMAER
jgi:acyl carrier protein